MNTIIFSAVNFSFIQLNGAIIGEIWIDTPTGEEYCGEIVTFLN